MLNRLLNSPAFAGTVVALVVGLLLSAFLLTKIVGEVISWENNQIYPSKTITVNGEGEEKAVPNVTTFNFSITEKANTMEEAQRKATEKSNKAIDFLKNNGVAEKDIKTEGYNSYPVYDYSRPCTAFDCPTATNKIIGYEVSQNVSVKVREQEEAGRFITELGKIGASNISGIYFEIEEDDSLKEKAKDKAIADAKEKAEKLADTLGVKLGDIVSFGEDVPYTPVDGYGMGGAEMMTKSVSSVAPSLPKGENTYTSRVWITYEIK